MMSDYSAHVPHAVTCLTRYIITSLFSLLLVTLAPVPADAAMTTTLTNAGCQQCHNGSKSHKILDNSLYAEKGDMRELTAIIPDKFAAGVHGKMRCLDCHTNITDNKVPHRKTDTNKISCAGCHEKLSNELQAQNTLQDRPRLTVVDYNTKAYRKSFHARDNADDPKFVNADCHQCHDTHFFNVPADKTGSAYEKWRLGIPDLCGKCHGEQLETYNTSVHGKEVHEYHNANAAVCTDCHTTHEITGTSLSAFKLLHPEECGQCHRGNLSTYRDTYHGQVSKLGYTYTAKCYDCHGSHGIVKVDNPDSPVHANNRLKTCRECHDGKKMPEATVGFVSFRPHAHAGDQIRYPRMWFAARFMIALLIGVFTFFWLHSGLWYYREWQDRKTGNSVSLVQTEAIGTDQSKQVQRFPLGWRIAHLAFAIITMTLVLTGTTALYAHSGWAPWVAKLFGGAQIVGLVHRIAATLFIGIFFVHFIYVLQHLLRKPGFRWLGPDSLIPSWKDFTDCAGMFKWFVGKGPRPLFDRWAYFEKFDYWAVFWGVTIIGISGLMLAFPHLTAQFLPGWVLNVATLVHGEEAFLAAVFLFTVHFFNNHFRPDKLPPPDIVMFTGSQSIGEFRRDHPAQYLRLIESGELDKYLVDAPSQQMSLGSKILGLALIAIGLGLLVLVTIGFFTAK